MLRVRLFNSGRLREKSCHRCSVPEKILKSFAKAEEPNKYVGKKNFNTHQTNVPESD